MAKVSAYFSNVFGHSPFSDLQNHAAICIAAAKGLRGLMPAASDERWDDVEQSYDRLGDWRT